MMYGGDLSPGDLLNYVIERVTALKKINNADNNPINTKVYPGRSSNVISIISHYVISLAFILLFFNLPRHYIYMFLDTNVTTGYP